MEYSLTRLKISLFIVTVSGLFQCCQKKIDSIDYKLLDIKANNEVNFCSLYSNWDSALVITPYYNFDKIEKLDISNTKTLRRELKLMKYDDFRNYLIFIKEREFVALSELPRSYLDIRLKNRKDYNFIYWSNCEFSAEKENQSYYITIDN